MLITDAAILNELENPLYSTDGGLTWSKWSGSFSVGTLQPGSDFSALQIRGAVPEGRTAVLNTAAVSSTTSDPDSGNNTVSITIPVIPSADLSITKEAAPSPAIPGETPVSYTHLDVYKRQPSAHAGSGGPELLSICHCYKLY